MIIQCQGHKTLGVCAVTVRSVWVRSAKGIRIKRLNGINMYRGIKGRRTYHCKYDQCPLEVADVLRGRPRDWCDKHRKIVTNEVSKAYYNRNKAARGAYAKKRRLTHKPTYDPVAARLYRQKNREKLRVYSLAYYYAHKS